MQKPEHTDIQETFITETNARYLGVDTTELMTTAGDQISELLLKKYGKFPSYAFVCGLGNNGGDGMATARQLAPRVGGQVTVYLVGRAKDITTDAATHQWELLQQATDQNPNLTVKQDVFAPDVALHHVIIECLSGTGRKGDIKKRFRDVIKRTSHFRQHLVALDSPVPGYTWELSISLMYPKTPDAKVIQLELPSQVYSYTGPGEVKALFQPRRDSYKSQNGKLLILGGSDEYHGAPLLAAQAASKYAGLVYFYSTPENEELIKGMESELAEFIQVPSAKLGEAVTQVDAVLVGNGWEDNIINKALLNYLLANFPQQKFIIDATAIGMADLDLVKKHGNVLFTPHRGELPRLLQVDAKASTEALEGRLRRFTAEFHCYVNLKSSISLMFGKNPFTGEIDMRINKTGNRGMAKGGSGDELAGITAAFATKNDLWLSMTAGAFISGLAGDLAQNQYGYMFSPTDTIACLQQAWQYCQEF